MSKLLICLTATTYLACSSIFAHENISPGQPTSKNAGAPYVPWLTGPLLAPYETAVSFGHFFIEPYANFSAITGNYNSRWESISAEDSYFSFTPQLQVYVGLTKWMDINFTPQMVTNSYKRQSDTQFADLPIALDFQIIPVDITAWYPSLKVAVQETFPTGTYHRLNPSKITTDISGAGTYGTNFNFVVYKLVNVWAHHFLTLYLNGGYTINSSTHVKGFNAYGGGYGTDGNVHVGNSTQGLFSFEFTLTQRWVLAMDTTYTHTDRSTFSGIAGHNADGSAAVTGAASSERLAFAPAIEYNINAKYGFIAGCFFSAIGRNTPAFKTATIAFAAYF